MKILFINRPKSFWTGGDYFQMTRTAEELRKLGHTVDIWEVIGEGLSRDTSSYDVIHGFNFSMRWSQWMKNEPKLAHQRFVASMIYHETEEFVPYTVQQEMINNLDAAVFLTAEELERAERHMSLDHTKVHFVNNGIDAFWFEPQRRFIDPRKWRYVLTVGRNDTFKGQRFVAEACEELGIRYISIGGGITRRFGPNGRNWLLPNKSQKDLVQWYANCAAFVLVSKNELMPLTVMEAGAQARNIVLTDKCGWKVPQAEYAEYGNVVSIKAALSKALEKPPNIEFQNMLKDMTWHKAAQNIETIYRKLFV